MDSSNFSLSSAGYLERNKLKVDIIDGSIESGHYVMESEGTQALICPDSGSDPVTNTKFSVLVYPSTQIVDILPTASKSKNKRAEGLASPIDAYIHALMLMAQLEVELIAS